MWFDSSSVAELAESIEAAELLKENMDAIKQYRSPSIETNRKATTNNKKNNYENRNKRSAGFSTDEGAAVKPKSPNISSGQPKPVNAKDKDEKRKVKIPRKS